MHMRLQSVCMTIDMTHCRQARRAAGILPCRSLMHRHLPADSRLAACGHDVMQPWMQCLSRWYFPCRSWLRLEAGLHHRLKAVRHDPTEALTPYRITVTARPELVAGTAGRDANFHPAAYAVRRACMPEDGEPPCSRRVRCVMCLSLPDDVLPRRRSHVSIVADECACAHTGGCTEGDAHNGSC